jgi:hypothetical protein
LGAMATGPESARSDQQADVSTTGDPRKEDVGGLKVRIDCPSTMNIMHAIKAVYMGPEHVIRHNCFLGHRRPRIRGRELQSGQFHKKSPVALGLSGERITACPCQRQELTQ